MVRKHFIFQGRVQGVGFRFMSEKFANKFSLSGWVRNNPDGTVEAMVQGKEDRIKLFLRSLKEYFKDYLTDFSQETLPESSEFEGFSIVFY